MKITKLETIRLLEFPNILWVRVHGEDGLCGLGETFMAAAAVEAFLHEIVAPRILGVDAHAIDLIASKLYGYLDSARPVSKRVPHRRSTSRSGTCGARPRTSP